MRNIMIVGLSALLMSSSAYAVELQLLKKVPAEKCLAVSEILQKIDNYGGKATDVKSSQVSALLAKFTTPEPLVGDEVVVAINDDEPLAHIFLANDGKTCAVYTADKTETEALLKDVQQ